MGPYVVNVCIYIYVPVDMYIYHYLFVYYHYHYLSVYYHYHYHHYHYLSIIIIYIYILYTAIGKSDAASNWPLDQLERGKKIIRSESQAARHLFYLEKASGYIFINYTMA